MIPRIKPINYFQQYFFSTIKDLIENKNVLIAEQYTIDEIIKYYRQFKLIETGEDLYTSFYGFPTKKSLKENFKAKLKNLWEKYFVCLIKIKNYLFWIRYKVIHHFGIYEFKHTEFVREKVFNEQKISKKEELIKYETLNSRYYNEIFLKIDHLVFGLILYVFVNFISFIVLIIEINAEKLKRFKKSK